MAWRRTTPKTGIIVEKHARFFAPPLFDLSKAPVAEQPLRVTLNRMRGERAFVLRGSPFPLPINGRRCEGRRRDLVRKIPNLKAFPLRFGTGFTNGQTMGSTATPFLNP